MSERVLRVGMLGCGTVGDAVIDGTVQEQLRQMAQQLRV